MNLVCGPEYAITTRNAMAQLSERETSFEIIEVCPTNCCYRDFSVKHTSSYVGPLAIMGVKLHWNSIAF